MYVEVRLGDLHVQRLSPVSVDPVTGDFSYESATGNIAVFNVSFCRLSTLCINTLRIQWREVSEGST